MSQAPLPTEQCHRKDVPIEDRSGDCWRVRCNLNGRCIFEDQPPDLSTFDKFWAFLGRNIRGED